jgi:hypothetical protein
MDDRVAVEVVDEFDNALLQFVRIYGQVRSDRATGAGELVKRRLKAAKSVAWGCCKPGPVWIRIAEVDFTPDKSPLSRLPLHDPAWPPS